MDDTICFIKIEYVEYILSVLNGFDNNTEFTLEEENDGVLYFLDVLICRNNNSIETAVYRKSTNNDIYLNWNAFSPDTWKRGTLKTLVERTYIAYILCSTEDFLAKVLKYLENVFHENNNYPKHVIKQILKQSHDEHNKQELDMTNRVSRSGTGGLGESPPPHYPKNWLVQMLLTTVLLEKDIETKPENVTLLRHF